MDVDAPTSFRTPFRWKAWLVRATVFIIAVRFLFYETDRWTESVRTQAGDDVQLEHRVTELRGCGGHGFYVGGGDEAHDFKFTWRDRNFKWDSGIDCTPIVLQRKGDDWYMACFDRTDMNNIGFRVYAARGSGAFHEIDRRFFPRRLAVVNAWHHNTDEIEPMSRLDTSSASFRRSLNAWLWAYIETGRQYEDGSYRSDGVEQSFLDEYKRLYAPTGTPKEYLRSL